MNSIIITGNICNDLELKSTESGKSVCSFNLAVKRPFAKDVTDFLTVVCWNKQAENVCKYCHKGTKIGVSGTLTTRSYQDKDRNTRTAYEVLVNEVEFLEKKADAQSSVPSANYTPEFGTGFDGFVPISDEYMPF